MLTVVQRCCCLKSEFVDSHLNPGISVGNGSWFVAKPVEALGVVLHNRDGNVSCTNNAQEFKNIAITKSPHEWCIQRANQLRIQ